MRNRSRPFLLPWVGLLLSPFALAQTTGTLEGYISDPGGAPLPGVTVEVTSPSLQGTRSTVTDDKGHYRVPSVPPGRYTVQASVSGFGSQQKSATVSLDAATTVSMQLRLSAAAEVTVSGEAPVVDTTATTSGTNYTSQVISKLPTARNYADIVKSQPGVQEDMGETQGRSLALSIYGSTSAENLFLIDGVNTTNVIKGFQGKAINNEFVQEVEVKTGGYQAEYGRNTGGVINVITKSGGNEFHGDVFGYYNSTGMLADQKIELTPDFSGQGDAQTTERIVRNDRWEAGADLGGYFIKDRLWFFGAFDHVSTELEFEPLDLPAAGNRYPQRREENLYSGKLTANLGGATTIVGSVFADPQSNEGVLYFPIRSLDPGTFSGTQSLGGTDWAIRANRLFGSTGILSVMYGQHRDRYLRNPLVADLPLLIDNTPSLIGEPPVSSGGFGIVFGPFENNESKRSMITGSFTGYAGNHEYKVGGDWQSDRTMGVTYYSGQQQVDVFPCLNDEQQPGDTSFCDLAQAPLWITPYGRQVPVFFQHTFFTAGPESPEPIQFAPFDVPTERWGLFVQDTWRVTPALTVNAGLRYDSETIKGGDQQVAFELENQWAPRLGLAWDFVGDGTSKLYASAGRFYYALPTDLSARAFTSNTFYSTNNYDIDSFAQNEAAPLGGLFQGGINPVDSGYAAAYQDELTVGIEKALGPELFVGLKGTYRTLGRAIGSRCDLDYTQPIAQGATCAIVNPGGSGPFASGDYLACNGSQNPTDPTAGECGLPGVRLSKAKRIFRGIELLARKQLSDQFWAQASVLYSSLRGNYSGAVRTAGGQTDPGYNADFDYPQFQVNDYGDLELDRPWQGRLDALWNAPFGLSAGLRFYVRSGTPTSVLGSLNSFYVSEILVEPRGTAGRLPTQYEMDFSLAYAIRVGEVTISPVIYIYNLLNNQIVTSVDQLFNPYGSFVTDPDSPFYGQPGVAPGAVGRYDEMCDQPVPCTDNPNYGKISPNNGGTAFYGGDNSPARTLPRLLRVALKISF